MKKKTRLKKFIESSALEILPVNTKVKEKNTLECAQKISSPGGKSPKIIEIEMNEKITFVKNPVQDEEITIGYEPVSTLISYNREREREWEQKAEEVKSPETNFRDPAQIVLESELPSRFPIASFIIPENSSDQDRQTPTGSAEAEKDRRSHQHEVVIQNEFDKFFTETIDQVKNIEDLMGRQMRSKIKKEKYK